MDKFNCASFFAGAGGIDIGFEQAGFDVVYANEYDKTFAELHDEGMSSWAKGHEKKTCPVSSTASLSDLTPEDILKTAFPKEFRICGE